jgi:hypothetical protein
LPISVVHDEAGVEFFNCRREAIRRQLDSWIALVVAALIAIWGFIRAFVAFEGGMALGFNTREAPDESHDAACKNESEHC